MISCTVDINRLLANKNFAAAGIILNEIFIEKYYED